MEEPKRNHWDEWIRQQFEEIRELGEGKPAIFMEYPTAHYVRVHGVTTDDWGVKLQITCIPAPGFEMLGRGEKESCQVACAWSAWDAEPTVWMARQISWRLLLDPVLVEAIVAEAAKVHAEGKQLHYHTALLCSQLHRAKMEAEKLGEDPPTFEM